MLVRGGLLRVQTIRPQMSALGDYPLWAFSHVSSQIPKLEGWGVFHKFMLSAIPPVDGRNNKESVKGYRKAYALPILSLLLSKKVWLGLFMPTRASRHTMTRGAMVRKKFSRDQLEARSLRYWGVATASMGLPGVVVPVVARFWLPSLDLMLRVLTRLGFYTFLPFTGFTVGRVVCGLQVPVTRLVLL